MTQRTSPFDCEVYGPGPNDFRLVLRRPVETRDSILNAVPIGKVCSLGRVWWAGDLRPILEAHVGTLKPLVTPFTIGNELDAEPPPGVKPLHRERALRNAPLEPKPTLGRSFGDQWRSTRDHISRVVDAMREQIQGRAKRDDDTDSGDTVDLGDVMHALTELKDQATNGHPNAVGAAIAALGGAIANVKEQPRSTSDAPVPFRDQGGRAIAQGALSANVADFRAGRTTDGRPRGKMQLANEERRRKLAAQREQAEQPWPPDAA